MGSLGEDTALPHLVVTVAALLVKEWRGHWSKSTRSMHEEEWGGPPKGTMLGPWARKFS
jgi:hypothetical protein